MTFNNDVIEAIGNTPLIKLKRASELTGCTILGKAEFMNPGQSVKDRAGKWMILEAENRGDLRPGRPVEQSRQREGAFRIDGSGNLGADRRQDRWVHLLGRHWRHAGGHQLVPE